jgi:hypothetical protein
MDKEAIARIIAPGSWEAYDRFIDPKAQPKTQLFVMIYREGLTTPKQWAKWWAEDAQPPHVDYHIEEWRGSIRKAAAILALQSSERGEGSQIERVGRAIALTDGEDYMEDHARFDRYARAALATLSSAEPLQSSERGEMQSRLRAICSK